MNFHYLRIRDGIEVDFASVLKAKILAIFEVKTSDKTPSKALKFLKIKLKLIAPTNLLLS